MPAGETTGPVLDTLSVLFTDLVGSTELRSRIGEDAAEVVRRTHDALIARVVDGNGGRVVKGLGDGFLATFGSAARAVSAAVGIQQGFDGLHIGDLDVRLSVRIGLSAGDVTSEAGDVFGTPVIEAARLCAAAEGDEILASSIVAVLAGARAGSVFQSVGPVEGKGLAAPIDAVRVAWERRTEADGQVPFPRPLESRAGSFPFRGRSSVAAEIATIWKHVRHERESACVLIAGEPGVGKTRLSSEIARDAHGGGALVLFGRCDEDLAVPYQPFVEALAHHVDGLSSQSAAALGVQAGELVRLVPDLTTRFPGLPVAGSSGDAEVDQFRLFEAVDAWLGAASPTAGVVLVLDDIHWAAKPTLLMLRHVLRSTAAKPVLIVATYRDTDLDRTHPLADLLSDLRRFDRVTRIALGGLDADGVADLLAAAAQQELDETVTELARAVHAETEGNPFFVGELIRHLVETGAIVHDGERWVGATAVADLAIPDGVREVVGRRLSRLSDDANDVLAWAAVLGRDLRLDVLAAVAGGEDRCLDALDEAVDARLMDEVGPGRWRFAHALVRSTLLAELRTTRRVRMHLALGEAYEQYAPDEGGALALHFAEAAPLGVGDRAVAYLLAAGADALEHLAFDQAADLFQRVLDILDDLSMVDPAASADAAHGLAVALRWSGGDYAGALTRACDEAIAMADGLRLLRVLMATSRGFATRVFVVDELAVERLERCLELLPPDDAASRCLALCELVAHLAYSDDLERPVALADEAVRLAAECDDAEVEIRALAAAATVEQFVDRWAVDEMFAMVEARVPMLVDPALVGLTASLLTGMGATDGRRDLWRQGLDRWREMDRAPGVTASQVLTCEAGYELRYGDPGTGARIAEAAMMAMAETNEPDVALWRGNLQFFARRQQGRVDEAVEALLPLLSEGILEFLPPAAIDAASGLVGMALAEAGRLDEARPHLEAQLAGAPALLRNSVWLAMVGALGVAAAELEAPEAAWVRAELEPFAARWACWGFLGTVGPVASIVGRLDLALGELAAADRWFDDAIARCRVHEAPYFLAEALLHRGRARIAAGDAEAAGPSLREALALAGAGGYGLIARRATDALDAS